MVLFIHSHCLFPFIINVPGPSSHWPCLLPLCPFRPFFIFLFFYFSYVLLQRERVQRMRRAHWNMANMTKTITVNNKKNFFRSEVGRSEGMDGSGPILALVSAIIAFLSAFFFLFFFFLACFALFSTVLDFHPPPSPHWKAANLSLRLVLLLPFTSLFLASTHRP